MSFRKIYKSLIVLLVGILLSGLTTSCVYEYPESEPDSPTRSAWVYLTLKVGVAEGNGSRTFTRAGSYYFEEPERLNEKLHSLRIFIVNSNNNLLEATRFINFDAGSQQIGSGLTFKLSPGLKRIYLVANEGSLPADIRSSLTGIGINTAFPADQLASRYIARTQNSPFYTLDQDLPMSEFFDIDLKNDSGNENGSVYVNADLFVTRLPVKYTFICQEDVPAIAVRLNDMAQDEYLFPKEATYFPDKYDAPEVIGDIAGRNIVKFNVPTARKSQFTYNLTGKTEIELEKEDGTKVKAFRYDPIYLMETEGTSFSMSIRFGEGAEIGTWFSDQVLPNLPLLPRNTHVIVYMSVKEYGLKCAVDVVPYRGCILDPYFGLERN